MPAPKNNKNAVGNEGGRPSLYKDEYAQHAYRLCLMGSTDAEIAKFFEVTETTINNWKQQHVEFLESIRAGKIAADMNVAHSLYKNTMDREVSEKKAIKLKEVYWDENGRRCEREKIEIVTETRIIPADFRNQSLWLRNRQPDKWSDKHVIESSTINQINLGEGEPLPEA